jgi:hypothetical protein
MSKVGLETRHLIHVNDDGVGVYADGAFIPKSSRSIAQFPGSSYRITRLSTSAQCVRLRVN